MQILSVFQGSVLVGTVEEGVEDEVDLEEDSVTGEDEVDSEEEEVRLEEVDVKSIVSVANIMSSVSSHAHYCG